MSLISVFEMVRRAALPKMNSRFRSYFAWETLDAARSFRKKTLTMYRIQAENGFRADQNWLTLGTQGVATSLCAHRYWSGAASSESLWEIVLRAPVRIRVKVWPPHSMTGLVSSDNGTCATETRLSFVLSIVLRLVAALLCKMDCGHSYAGLSGDRMSLQGYPGGAPMIQAVPQMPGWM
jgi:hypothetical protein